MASLLLAAGEPGERRCLPNARIMVHQPIGGAQASAGSLLYSLPVPACSCCSASLRHVHVVLALPAINSSWHNVKSHIGWPWVVLV